MTKKIKNLEIETFEEFSNHHADCANKYCLFEEYLTTLPKVIGVKDWDELDIPKWILAKYFEVFSYIN